VEYKRINITSHLYYLSVKNFQADFHTEELSLSLHEILGNCAAISAFANSSRRRVTYWLGPCATSCGTLATMEKPRRRRAALFAAGVHPKLASNTADSGHGPWYLAHAKALSVALPFAYFKSLRLPNLEDAS
jgi:hypothetical protein